MKNPFESEALKKLKTRLLEFLKKQREIIFTDIYVKYIFLLVFVYSAITKYFLAENISIKRLLITALALTISLLDIKNFILKKEMMLKTSSLSPNKKGDIPYRWFMLCVYLYIIYFFVKQDQGL